MAGAILSDYAVQIAQTFDASVRSQIERSSPLLAWLPKKPYYGKAIDWRVSGSGRTVTAFASGAAAPAADFDARKTAALGWGRYGARVSIARDALQIARNQPGNGEAVQSLYEEEFSLATAAISKAVNDDLYNGAAGGNTIVGLDTALSASTGAGSYAGIDGAVDTWWASATAGVHGTETVLALTDMTLIGHNVFTSYGAPLGPQDAYFTTGLLFKKYGDLLAANPRTIVNENTNRLAGGWASLESDGVPVFRDLNATAKRIYGLRKSEIELCYLPMTDERGFPVMSAPMTGGAQGEQAPQPVMLNVIPLSVTGHAVEWFVWVQLQLKVRSRFAHISAAFKDA